MNARHSFVPPGFAHARVQMIRKLAAEGMSKSTIAANIGISRERVRQICNRDGIETVSGMTDADLSDRMRECAGSGMTIQQAAQALGRTVGGMRGKAKREGIVFAEPAFRWHEVRDAAAEGLTLTECARRMGWNTNCVWNEAKRRGIIFRATKRAERQSEVKGVSWKWRIKRWVAYIRRDGKQTYLGSFVNESDAIAARKAAEETA